MGARTSTSKGNDDDLTRNQLNSSPYLPQSSKRRKIEDDRPLTSKSTFSPDFTLSRPRAAVPAPPVKSLRFGTCLSPDLSEVSRAAIGIDSFDMEEDIAMGITLSKMDKYEKTRKEARSSLRFTKLKEEIDLVEEKEEDQGQKEVNLEDSSKHALPSVKEIPREPFVALTDEEEIEVQHALASHQGEVLVVDENSNIEITGGSLQCLRPCAWLNDEVINFYMELLKEREEREPKKFLKCHFFNTFFYKKLIGGKGGYDYESIRRWTTQRKLGYSLIDCDKIFVPIQQEVHWCLAIINNKDKKFQYLDSLGGKDCNVLEILARYLVDEVKDKNGKDIDVGSWQTEYVQDLPKQENHFDCGMFMIKYADFYSRGLGLCFKQEHMPYFRRRTAKEILKLRAD